MTIIVRSSGLVQNHNSKDTFSADVRCETGEVAIGWAFNGDSDPSILRLASRCATNSGPLR